MGAKGRCRRATYHYGLPSAFPVSSRRTSGVAPDAAAVGTGTGVSGVTAYKSYGGGTALRRAVFGDGVAGSGADSSRTRQRVRPTTLAIALS